MLVQLVRADRFAGSVRRFKKLGSRRLPATRKDGYNILLQADVGIE